MAVNAQSTDATLIEDATPVALERQFPPCSPSLDKKASIIDRFCRTFDVEAVEETGCAVSGQLILVTETVPLACCKNLDLLASSEDTTCKTCMRSSDPISSLAGPVLANGCKSVCADCELWLKSSRIPLFLLTNYLWLGDVPLELQGLTYAEKTLVVRVRHNKCVIRVQSGAHKMAANAISFANPMPDVYDMLPPPLAELDSILVLIFTGPCHLEEKELRRTPMLVRRNKVKMALEWLKLNHQSYADLNIPYGNLEEYPDSDALWCLYLEKKMILRHRRR